MAPSPSPSYSPVPTVSPSPPPASPPPATTTPTPTPTNSTSEADIQMYLDIHNVARAKHGAPPVAWNAKMGNFTQKWANNCKFEHSDGGYTGMLRPLSVVLIFNDLP